MSNLSATSIKPIARINPALDFTEDTAFVAVNRGEGTAGPGWGRVTVLTSDREQIPWDGESLWEAGLSAGSDPPRLLEPRWSRGSIEEFLSGAPQPATAQIQGEIRGYLQKYLGFRHPAEYDLVAIWIMGTYLKPLFKCYPILFFNAPYESGKSRCLEAISQLAFNGKWFGEISPAAFRRYGTEIKPTFCLDEVTELGEKSNSALIGLLLNAYNSSEAILTGYNRHDGWRPELFKVESAVALGNAREIKNKALQSRTIPIRTEYDPRFRNTNLPRVDHPEPGRIRDGLYGWALSQWRSVRECYQNYPVVPALSAREIDSYKPLLALAALAGPEAETALTGYAGAARKRNLMLNSIDDDRHDLLAFLRHALTIRRPGEEFPLIANKELADAYNSQNKLRLNYRRFLELVTALRVVQEVRNYSGSKQLVLNLAEIERQLKLIESKS